MVVQNIWCWVNFTQVLFQWVVSTNSILPSSSFSKLLYRCAHFSALLTGVLRITYSSILIALEHINTLVLTYLISVRMSKVWDHLCLLCVYFGAILTDTGENKENHIAQGHRYKQHELARSSPQINSAHVAKHKVKSVVFKNNRLIIGQQYNSIENFYNILLT